MTTLKDTLKQFDEKFSIRIYGIAGEPKSEFRTTENVPRDVRSFISKEVSALITTAIKEIEKKKKEQLDKNNPDNYGACYAIAGFNHALQEAQEKLKQML